MAEETGLKLALTQTPKTGFLETRPNEGRIYPTEHQLFITETDLLFYLALAKYLKKRRLRYLHPRQSGGNFICWALWNLTFGMG